MFVRSDTEADDAFLNDSGSQYNSLVGILFCRTTTPLFNQVNYFLFLCCEQKARLCEALDIASGNVCRLHFSHRP
jgi:hypothetical protein